MQDLLNKIFSISRKPTELCKLVSQFKRCYFLSQEYLLFSREGNLQKRHCLLSF